MKLLHVTAKNFLSLKELDLDLDNQGLVLLDGNNLDSVDGSFEANGSGKSSLLASIFYALYGETPDGRSADAIINSQAGKEAVVTITLANNGHTYVISRGRKKNFITIMEDDDKLEYSTMKETQAKVEEIVGIPEEVFRTTIFFDGHYTTPFSEMTDKQKKEFLSAVVDLDVYSRAHEQTKEDMKAVKAELATIESNISIATEASQRELDNIRKLSENEQYYKQELDKATSELAKFEATMEPEDSYKSRENEAQSTVNSLSNYKVTSDALNKLNEATSIINKLSFDLKTKENEKKQLEQQQVSIKDTMRSKVELIKNYEAMNSSTYDIDDMHVAFNLGRDGHPEEAVDELIPSGADMTPINKLKEELQGLVSSFKGINPNGFDSVITALDAEINARKEELPQLQILAEQEAANNTSINAKYQEAVNNLNAIKSQRQDAINQVNTMKSNISYLENSLKLVREQQEAYNGASANTTVEDLEKTKNALVDKLVSLEQVLGAFSDKGIKSHVLDLVTPTLNAGVNKYLAVLTGGAIVAEFSTQTKKADGTMSEKFDVAINYNGIDTSYKSLSSGEKRRVDVAISLALQDMVMQRYGTDINVLAYDELFESLDAIGSENIVQLLHDRLDDVGTIIVISHNQDLKPLFDKIITVEKKDGISSLKK